MYFFGLTLTTMIIATIIFSFHIILIFYDHTSLVNIGIWLHFANLIAVFECEITTSKVILFILLHLALVLIPCIV